MEQQPQEQQPAQETVLPIYPTEVILQWDNWLQGQVQAMRLRQQQMDAMLAQAMAPQGIQIPGVEYGSTTNKGLTVLLIGDLGTWKTAWCCQWPNPFILSVQSEGGDDTLVMYPKLAVDLLGASKVHDPPAVFNVKRPPSRPIKGIGDMLKWVDDICRYHRQWKIYTVAVDSLTYLIDMWISEHTARRRGNKVWTDAQKSGKVDLMRPGDWGMLNAFLRDIRVRLCNEGLNVIFTVLSKPIFEQDPTNQMERVITGYEPMLSGQQRITLPGACKLHIFAEKQFLPHPTVMGRQIAQPTFWTSPSTKIRMIRHKYADKFPQGKLFDPEFGSLPTFRAIWQELSSFIYLGA